MASIHCQSIGSGLCLGPPARPCWGFWAVVLAALLLLPGAASRAERLPLWELGFGGGLIQVPDYLGSSEARVYPYPLIIPVYRGRHFQADEEGIKGALGERNWVRLDISLYGNVPVDRDNDAREGMDELDPLVEIGPMLRLKPWASAEDRQSLIIDLPVRVALSVGHGVESVGYAVTPRVSYRRQLGLLGRPWRWSMGASLLWGSEGLHDYFYGVNGEDATLARPAYDPAAGFAGSRLQASLYRRGRNTLFSLYAVYDNLQGAVFQGSPLVEQDYGLTVGFLVSWFPVRSQRVVEVEQWEWRSHDK